MERDENGRWKKGQTGNEKRTGGNRRGADHIRELARQWSQEAIRTLADIMMDEEADASDRVKAAIALLDRAWGKPTIPLDHQGEGFSLTMHLGGKPAAGAEPADDD